MRSFNTKKSPETTEVPVSLADLNAELSRLDEMEARYQEISEDLISRKQSGELPDSDYIIQIDAVGVTLSSIRQIRPELIRRIDAAGSSLAHTALGSPSELVGDHK